MPILIPMLLLIIYHNNIMIHANTDTDTGYRYIGSNRVSVEHSMKHIYAKYMQIMIIVEQSINNENHIKCKLNHYSLGNQLGPNIS